MNNKNFTIGFIGQGWIGKHYADDFEKRGYETVRYALEAPYNTNQSLLANCEIVFIAVPTPTTPKGFDDSILRDALQNVAPNKIAVIKSTTTPGLTKTLQQDFPDITILHSPEFLAEKTAAHDAANPNRNLIGVPEETKRHQQAAKLVLSVLPQAPYEAIMSSLESELVKYAGNCFLYTKVLFMNALYDLSAASGADFETIRRALIHDPRIGESHTNPIHASGHINQATAVQRGAGGHCFIKDFEAFTQYYENTVGKDLALKMLRDMTTYNNQLLVTSGKDLDLLEGVYGSGVLKKNK